MKPICVAVNEEERDLMRISAKEKIRAARIINPKPLARNRLMISTILSHPRESH